MKICPDYLPGYMFYGMHQMMMVAPVNADIDKAQHITVEYRGKCKKCFPADIVWNFYFKDHNGDDNSEYSIAEGF